MKGCSSRLRAHTSNGPRNPSVTTVASAPPSPSRCAAIPQPRTSELSPDGLAGGAGEPAAGRPAPSAGGPYVGASVGPYVAGSSVGATGVEQTGQTVSVRSNVVPQVVPVSYTHLTLP